MAKITAVIDIGSNSARMVIYEKTSRFAFHLLHEVKSRVRLPENAYKNGGNLQEEAMQRTYDALENFLSIASSFKARKILCVATSALRDAPNKKEFISRVRSGLKLNIKVIDGEKEALYGALACCNLLPQAEALTIDIGGGSTEFSYILNGKVENTLSLALGTVRLKELFFDKKDIEGAKKYINEELDKLSDISISNLIGIGGTFRALSRAIMKDIRYPLNKLHAFECSSKTMSNFIDKILNANERRLKHLNIRPDRYDVIKPGSLIISELLKRKNDIDNLITSGVGVREGVYLSDLLRGQKDSTFPANFNPSVRYLLDSYIFDKNHSNQLAKLSKHIFDLICESYDIDEKYKKSLVIGAKLSPIGASLHNYSSNQHSYYLIQTALEYGFTHQEIILIATLTRYAKRKAPATAHITEYKNILPDEKIAELLSFIISLSSALLTHRPRNLDYNIGFNENSLQIASKDNLYLVKDAVKNLEFPQGIRVEFV
ncbi:Ppx/GppA phosphatase family protein [Sulfurimonas sp. HSL-1716]|uniref:Ppx/GppA phosphatase family protein n=1 Tax=Hydrocurvibacter sulfurireducens TaxID=3131937 RepID=UPI0031F8FB6B